MVSTVTALQPKTIANTAVVAIRVYRPLQPGEDSGNHRASQESSVRETLSGHWGSGWVIWDRSKEAGAPSRFNTVRKLEGRVVSSVAQ